MRVHLALAVLTVAAGLAGCASTEGPLEPGRLRVTGLEVANDAKVDVRYPALFTYEANGDVQIYDSCFLWSDPASDLTLFGEGPYCFAPETGPGPGAVKAMLISGYGGTYRLEGYVRYFGGGILHSSNSVSHEVTVKRRY